MTLIVIVVAVLAALGSIVWDGHRRGTRRFRLEQFRPAAPFVGFVDEPGLRDVQRVDAELRMIRDHGR